MKTLIIPFLVCALILPALASSGGHEQDRVENAGHVLKEILNIPDNIPQDLLDKAECIIVLPSVKKAAFGVGGSYGRGVMICRSGVSYTGPWGRLPCTPWKARASASNLEAKPPTSSCW